MTRKIQCPTSTLVTSELKYWYVGLDAQWNDEAEFSCVTEDGERVKAQLTVLTTNKKPKKVEKKKLVIKKVEFNEKASEELVDRIFDRNDAPGDDEKMSEVRYNIFISATKINFF